MMVSASMQRSNWRVYCVHRHRRGERLPQLTKSDYLSSRRATTSAHEERKVGLVVPVSGDSPPRTIEFTCFTTGLTDLYVFLQPTLIHGDVSKSDHVTIRISDGYKTKRCWASPTVSLKYTLEEEGVRQSTSVKL